MSTAASSKSKAPPASHGKKAAAHGGHGAGGDATKTGAATKAPAYEDSSGRPVAPVVIPADPPRIATPPDSETPVATVVSGSIDQDGVPTPGSATGGGETGSESPPAAAADPSAGGAGPARRSIMYRALDSLLRIVNRPFAFLGPSTRVVLGWVGLITIGLSILVDTLGPRLFPGWNPVRDLKAQVAELRKPPTPKAAPSEDEGHSGEKEEAESHHK